MANPDSPNKMVLPSDNPFVSGIINTKTTPSHRQVFRFCELKYKVHYVLIRYSFIFSYLGFSCLEIQDG
jgi:hypothetical protein